MALRFPNYSRSYDTARRAVRFWGYDSAMETSFFVTEEALRRLQPAMSRQEDDILRAFDANRDLICSAASKAYERGRKSWYQLGPGEFPGRAV